MRNRRCIFRRSANIDEHIVVPDRRAGRIDASADIIIIVVIFADHDVVSAYNRNVAVSNDASNRLV